MHIFMKRTDLSNNELLEAMNKHVELMYTRLEENKVEIKESLSVSLKAEVSKEVTARTQAMKAKISRSRVLGDELSTSKYRPKLPRNNSKKR